MSDSPFITQPGIYDGVPSKVYHSANITPEPALSCGVLKKLLTKSALHAWMDHPALNPEYAEVSKDTFDIGTAAHALFLEGIDKAEVLPFDSYRTKEAKQARELARMNGNIPMLVDKYGQVCEMVNAAKRQLEHSDLRITDLQAEGKAEQTLIWQEDGLWFKARPDWMPHDMSLIFDYKTTGVSANPAGIGRHISSMNYEIQAAFYRRGLYCLTGIDAPFHFMFQEDDAPYLSSFPILDWQSKAIGEGEVQRGIELWFNCLSSDEWPGYSLAVYEAECPAWQYKEWCEQCESEI